MNFKKLLQYIAEQPVVQPQAAPTAAPAPAVAPAPARAPVAARAPAPAPAPKPVAFTSEQEAKIKELAVQAIQDYITKQGEAKIEI